MKKNNKAITIVSVALLIMALVGSLFLDDVLGAKIANIVTILTAIIGAVALFLEFKRDKNINEAGFIINYSNDFYDIYELKEVLNELEEARKNKKYVIDMKQHYQDIVAYLQWLESLASLINSKVISVEKVDNVLSYRFFLIVNNKQIQQQEIIPCKEFYKGIYNLYEKWYDYKKKTNQFVVFEENSLSETKGYDEIVKKIKD